MVCVGVEGALGGSTVARASLTPPPGATYAPVLTVEMEFDIARCKH